MALLRAGLLVVLFVAAAAASEGCEAEDEALLQVTKVDTMAGSRVTPKTWKSPRDLAYVPPPQTVKLSSFLNISIYSAVPSFGRDGNFIALLQDGDEGSHTRNLRRHLSENSLFCSDDSDDNGTFRSQVQMHGMGKPILVCEWPEKDAQLETYQVRLENSKGEKLGTIVAQHKPQLLKDQDYKVVACVRDVFEDQTPDGPNHGKEQFSGPFKQLVEWLEFSSLHGVDHFFVYTFQGTEAVAEDVLQPYLKSGLATRIHFQHYPASTTRRQLNMANDCLYRAKSHAKWLMPTIDADEYFHLNLAELFPQTKVPVDYLNSVWDRIVLKNHYALNQVSSVYFNKIRFARAPLDQLDISSKWREKGVERNTKYVANVKQVHELKTHKSSSARPNTVRLRLLQQLGFMGHYRVDQHHRVNYNETWFMKDERASIEDPALLSDVPLIEERIRKRFGQDPKVLLKSLVARRPPSTYEVAQLLITSPATAGA